jgi:hypothetical protein
MRVTTPLQTDSAILTWIERHTTLHQTVEFLYTVGAIEASLVDDRSNGVTYRSGANLREAVSALMEVHP